VAIVLVPTLKYPANPPAVGNPETIGVRTAAFFFLIVISVAAIVLALQVRRKLSGRFGNWNSSLLAAALFLIIMGTVAYALPVVDEVPAGFPVTLMWRFRVAALEIQAVMWATLGILFGWLTERDGKWQQLQS
jgi:predicted cobalt transporter CbtA